MNWNERTTMITTRLTVILTFHQFFFAPVPLLAQEKNEPKPPVEAKLIVIQSEYILPRDRHSISFRQRIEEETDGDNLPSAPKVDLVLELRNR